MKYQDTVVKLSQDYHFQMYNDLAETTEFKVNKEITVLDTNMSDRSRPSTKRHE